MIKTPFIETIVFDQEQKPYPMMIQKIGKSVDFLLTSEQEYPFRGQFFTLDFGSTNETFGLEPLYQFAEQIFDNFHPKEAVNLNSDCNEYYDRKYKDNGDLKWNQTTVAFYPPYASNQRIYQMNQAKFEDFVYTIAKKLKQGGKQNEPTN